MHLRAGYLAYTLCLVATYQTASSYADVLCSTTEECTRALLEGSECVNGLCTNPFYNGGCLHHMLPNWHKVRTCNSEDPPEAVEKGFCRPSPLGYREVRVASQSWEAAYFGTWILQILLGELLDVPVTVESGVPDVNVNLYNINASYGYGSTADFDSLRVASDVEDCTRVTTIDPQDYVACSHVNPEFWLENILDGNEDLELKDLGVLASLNWYIPKYTAERDPSLVPYTGLTGERFRRKLAERFPRPFSWQQYCDLFSRSNCEEADDIAARAPKTEDEKASYFAEGLFFGFFDFTEKNDCEKNPVTCTGHIADFPCDWETSVIQHTYHLGIALDSDGPDPHRGYTPQQIEQVWKAANHSKTDVIILWYKPTLLYQTFLGTEAELTRVVLPPPTQTCLDNRLWSMECDIGIEELKGDARGSCDYPEQTLKKIINRKIQDSHRGVDQVLWSPAYDAISNYRINNFQLGEIFDLWQEVGKDQYHFEPRRAACRWVVKNIDLLKAFIPASHPRAVEPESLNDSALHIVGLAVAVLAMVVLVVTAILTRFKRNSKAIFYAQETFLYLILGGLFLVATGGLFYSLHPTDGTCLSTAWFVNIGYCIVFIPLYLRITAISALLQSGKKMQRVRLSEQALFGKVAVALTVITGFLVAWTLVDAPRRDVDFELGTKVNNNGEIVVLEIKHCSSDSSLWVVFSFIWQGAILLLSGVVSFTSLVVKEDINDTRSLAVTFLSHMTIFLLRCSLWLLGDSIRASAHMVYQSMLFSADCLAVVALYVAPKIMDKGAEKDFAETDPDLFMDTSILIADIVGFAAWSSVREPVQVFRFLEIVYGAFDEIAEKRNIFKVETSGNCYVAACGIPRPQADHALVTTRFAWDCINKLKSLSRDLELTFGPDTGTLSLRIGIHSGPVTGGFLKGKGARFQLFGDTMNTTIKLARSSEKGLIQVSGDTAKLLINAGKQRWLEERTEKVSTSGKGMIQTYWINRVNQNKGTGRADDGVSDGSSNIGSDLSNGHDFHQDVRQSRMIDWNVEVLHQLLKQIVVRRTASTKQADDSVKSRSYHDPSIISMSSTSDGTDPCIMPLNEVQEVISLPEFDARAVAKQKDTATINLPEHVLQQLKYFVTTIAQMYNDNPFHNFNHASHVVMAVSKFMNRINEARDLDVGDEKERKFNEKKFASALHDHTYGITSDPLTQFACVFSALIHDVDHPGVPNPQLVKENETLASTYRCRSVAEQNSFDLAWNLLKDNHFKDLLATICATKSELIRFRQIVINSVMATDLGDKELKELRNGRWEKAFSTSGSGDEISIREAVNRKATIVVEHLIQAADVSHTTQHWEVYRVWNENLFRELYKAYTQGRAEKNPAEYWYQGEIGFFDFYIIPLAKKLRDCGVFGLTSDENLNYALQNRQLWVERGSDIVDEMLNRAITEFGGDVAQEAATAAGAPSSKFCDT